MIASPTLVLLCHKPLPRPHHPALDEASGVPLKRSRELQLASSIDALNALHKQSPFVKLDGILGDDGTQCLNRFSHFAFDVIKAAAPHLVDTVASEGPQGKGFDRWEAFERDQTTALVLLNSPLRDEPVAWARAHEVNHPAAEPNNQFMGLPHLNEFHRG
jgi:hypothetical protein